MTEWIRVDSVEDFEREVKVYVYKDNPIAVFRLEDGFYAIDDTCTHARASLSEGEIIDDEIECPLHGAVFNIKTGKNLTLPAVKPVRSHPVKVEDGEIYLLIEDENSE